ncbi:TPA: hypothetical protein HA278_04375 [Candidatus Woesearchaeota archaeon]|nr:hypothetical protein [Candidatus Woesearchaeota archaeon]|tara:strand:- start:205 stop:852 length:648 start_codon:yes stop_codon:yes gene_type:complete
MRYRKKKDPKLFSKILVITLMVLLVLGFTVPGFLHGNQDTSQGTYVEPRFCQADANCYLTCDGAPLATLCSQNLCVQNSCEEGTLYPYVAVPTTFTLIVNANSSRVDLPSRMNEQNLFVTFADDTVSLFSTGMVLGQVLEKVNVVWANGCLSFGTVRYCEDESNAIILTVNGEESGEGTYYQPQEGDLITISHQQRVVDLVVREDEPLAQDVMME